MAVRKLSELERVVVASQRLASRTKRMYHNRVRAFVKFAGEDPESWTTRTVERWRDAMLDRGLKPQTVNLYLAAVQFASKRMAQLGSGADFVRAAERARSKTIKTPPRALTVRECQLLLSTCNDPSNPMDLRDRAMILLGIHTGMRRESICAVEFDDIRGRNIRFVQKGDRLHAVNLDRDPWAAIQAWINWLKREGIRSGRLFRSVRQSVASDWSIGESITPDGFAKNLRERGNKVGIEGLHPHMLRHTYASLALAAGVPAWRVKKTLGHKTDVMLERYTHDLDPNPVGASFPSLTGLPDDDEE